MEEVTAAGGAGDNQSFASYSEKCTTEVKDTLTSVLGSKNYDAEMVATWVDSITQAIVAKLQAMSADFKYIVSVIVLQRTNSGFHLFSTCYWDQERDATVTIRWDSESMHCIVTVYGVALALPPPAKT